MTNRKTASDSGFALVSTIWISGLLAVVATAFVIAVHSRSVLSSNIASSARAELIADGVALHFSAQLSETFLKSVSGETTHCRWSNDATVTIKIQDHGGLVDLNTATPELMVTLLKGLGVSPKGAAKMSAALVDYRDPDSQKANGENEPAKYDGFVFGPKNAPFELPEEIDQVPEIDDAIFVKLVPLLTTYSQQTGIDLSKAPQRLLTVLGGQNQNIADLQKFASPSTGKVFTVEAVAILKNGGQFNRQTIVSILRQPDKPFSILSWVHGSESIDPKSIGTALPPCFTQ